MITKEDVISISAYFVNWFSACFNTLLLFIGTVTVNQWGIVAGIIFGAITAAANVWAKHRMVKIAERTGQVNI